MTSKNKKTDKTKMAVRILCIALAALLILSSIGAIFGLFN